MYRMANSEVNDLAISLGDNLSIGDSQNESICTNRKITSYLENLECPFSWNLNFKGTEDVVSRTEDKLSEEMLDENELFHWKTFVLNLILCYEYGREGNLVDALEKQAICDAILDQSDDDPHLLPVMRKGLRHISLACKCFLLTENVEIKKIRDTIVLYEDLGPQEKASILSIKGSFCAEYGYDGIRLSISAIEQAVAIDKDCAVYNFLLARSMGRLRRIEQRSAIPQLKEIKLLEHCCDISNHSSFIVLLAQTYRETARNVFFGKKREFNSFKPYCDSLNEKAANLFRKVLQDNSIETKNVSVLIRCANGLMKLPKPWKDMNSAKLCISKALDLAPKNPMANHVAGTYYSMMNDLKEATFYFSKAAGDGVFGAEIDLISLKARNNESYNPCADLKRCLEIYHEKPCQETLLCLLGSYYYTYEKNFKNAFEYWLKVIEEDIKSEKLRAQSDLRHKSIININNIVLSEIMKLLDTGNISTTEEELYNKIITMYIEHHPGLVATKTSIEIRRFQGKKFEYSSWKRNRNGKTNIHDVKNKLANSRANERNRNNFSLSSSSNTKFYTGPTHDDASVSANKRSISDSSKNTSSRGRGNFHKGHSHSHREPISDDASISANQTSINDSTKNTSTRGRGNFHNRNSHHHIEPTSDGASVSANPRSNVGSGILKRGQGKFNGKSEKNFPKPMFSYGNTAIKDQQNSVEGAYRNSGDNRGRGKGRGRGRGMGTSTGRGRGTDTNKSQGGIIQE